MKFKIIILFIFFYSCVPLYNQNISYNSSGFALIFNQNDYLNKKISKKLNNDNFEVAHRILKPGTIVRITNPSNKSSMVIKIKKRADNKAVHFLFLECTQIKKQLSLRFPIHPRSNHSQIEDGFSFSHF